MILNKSEKVKKIGFPVELYETFENSLNVALADRGLDFHLVISDSIETNAHIRKYGIELCQGLIETLYCAILNDDVFKIAVNGIKKRYNVLDDISHLSSITLNLAISICFYHEFGHIVNGHVDFLEDNSQELFSEAPQSSKGEDKYTIISILEYDADAYAGKSIAGLVQNNLIFECLENVRPIVEEQLIQLASFALFYILNCKLSDENIFTYPPYLWRMLTISRIAMEGLKELREHGKFLDSQMNVTLDEIFSEDFKQLSLDISKIIKSNAHSGIRIFSSKKMHQWLDYYTEHRGILEKVHKCIADPSKSIFYKKKTE